MKPAEDLEKGPGQRFSEVKSDVAPPVDWTNRLDKGFNIEVLEFRAGSSEWETASSIEIEAPSSLPESVLIRLYLVEGLAQRTLSYFSNIKQDFFRHHYLDVLPYDLSGAYDDCFFAKWSRRVYQSHAQWEIEDRIAKGRPYNLDSITDPRDVSLEHDRYERAQGVYRPYSSLEPTANSKGEYIPQAVKECVSTYYKRAGNTLTGVILFDAPRKVWVTHEDYRHPKKGSAAKKRKREPRDCFSYFTPSRRRFREQLRLPMNFEALTQSPEQSIRDTVVRFMVKDHMEIMSNFREALDFIDEHMSNDRILRDSLQHWRDLFGQWKRSLPNEVSSIAYVRQALHFEQRSDYPTEDGDAVNPKPIGRTKSVVWPAIQNDLDRLTREVTGLTERAGSTFQALMATMGIVESQKAIAQAETISKLTNLAFFFIPLTLTASIFGMNITEWQDQLRTWTWVLVSIMVMIFTYIALYFNEVTIAVSKSPNYVQTVSVNSAASRISRWISYSVYYGKQLGRGVGGTLKFLFSSRGLLTSAILLLVLGWVLGIWAIATRTNMVYGSKVAVGVGFAVGVPTIILLWVWIWDEDTYAWPEVAVPGLLIFAPLLVGIGVSIWAVFRYADLPYDSKVSIAVGMGVGIPGFFTLMTRMVQSDVRRRVHLTIGVATLGLAPVLWAIITKTNLAQDVKVSLSVGLGTGLPCGLVIFLLIVGWD